MYALPRVHNLLHMHSWYTHTYSMYVQEKLMRTHVRTYVRTYYYFYYGVLHCRFMATYVRMYVYSSGLSFQLCLSMAQPTQSQPLYASIYCTYYTYIYCTSFLTYVQYIRIQMYVHTYVRMPMQAHKCLPLPVLAWAGHAFSKETSYSCTTYLHA